MKTYVTHAFKPIYNETSRILILGTMPSPKSRENGFYYSHPQNRFWQVIAALLQKKTPQTIEEKEFLLLDNHIAIWDVLHSCEIVGADDSKIEKPVVNDFREILKTASIKAIFTTGKKATALYKKHCFPVTNIESIYLPSTSPANCGRSLKVLTHDYLVILNYLNQD